MPTLNASKWAEIGGPPNQPNHTAARDASTGFQLSNNPSSGDLAGSEGILYKRASGRGGNIYSIRRSFVYFDTSGNTGTISNVTLNVAGLATATADVIVVKSTAFGGDGASSATTSDYSNVTFSTPYSSEFTSWNTDGSVNISISLNSTAESDISSNDYFICALIEHDHDYSDSDPGTNVTKASGFRWATAGSWTLSFDEAAASGPANVTSLSSIAKADITSVNTIAIADISSINSVS